ncbi:class II fructose-1,6-bisphosphate aldolase [Alicyclobacillus vulcanalis]|uniref:6-phospho-5-dehydro-2-deoxy-D-gluconate aldolase n=1 Tax=Alicyclobacillus vulcanalis TaxID=252246 RepID=A0A1N7NM68_9BACL|nr:class II fructose-1,6-bisphosphate aldolase [Alicyclobacillus vulcanalis]SIS99328.1 6-phospho-5-dehydro-2-deoxy-D-gluconate aldolase [Alicyclobacillus vulcanalis]
MPLVTLCEVLPEAKRHRYAVGQFNVNDFLWIPAILEAAVAEYAPVILGVSDRLVDYLGGFRSIVMATQILVEEHAADIPVVLHLDHGRTVERCKAAVDAGFTSVMFDGSHLPLDKNIALTRAIVEYAHARGVSVEAEIGQVGGIEDGVVSGIVYANPDDCVRMAGETKVDALAVALGSVHGPYTGEPKIDFERLSVVAEKIETPLVLHGGSGIPREHMQLAIFLGYSKVNVNTECSIAFRDAVQHFISSNPEIYEPRFILGAGREAIAETVQRKIVEFGAAKRAQAFGNRATCNMIERQRSSPRR